MKKEIFEWNYNPPKSAYRCEQLDWNQTLMTMINKMDIARKEFHNHVDEISPLFVPSKFLGLIKSLLYFDYKTEILSNRFKVIESRPEDYIELDGFKLKILNYKTENMDDKKELKKVLSKYASEPTNGVNKDTFLVKEIITEHNDVMEATNGKDMTAKTGKGEGLRFNKGKLRYDLVEPRAHRDMVKVLTYGATKYFDRNWENGLGWSSIIASAKRHLAAIEQGEDYDYDPNCEGCKNGDCQNHSGELHVANLACNAHFLNAFYYTFPQGDDRPKRFLKQPKIGLDIDGVIANYVKAWHELYSEIPIDPSTYFFDGKIMKRFDDMREDGTLDDFYLNIEPLITCEDLPFEPHCYVTARPVDTEITKQWLAINGFPNRKVITVPTGTSKVEAMKEAGIEIFIDDFYDNFVELNAAGIFTYLFTTPWNIKYDVGHMRIDNLKDLPLLKK